MLNEKEASQLSDIKFKELDIGKLNELTDNYPKTTGKLQWTHCKLYQHERGNRNYQQGPRGNEEYNSSFEELKNTVEGIKNRLDEAEDQISELEDKVEKNTQTEQEKEKSLRKNERD